jgi:hypothetical protein
MWRVVERGAGWIDAPELKVHDCTAAMLAAAKTKTISLSGLKPSSIHFDCMGAYALVVGKMVNGRGVWKQIGEDDGWLFYSRCKGWFVSVEEDMEEGKGSGYFHVRSTAITPDRASEMWLANDVVGGSGWIDAPKLKAHRQRVHLS